MRTGDMEPLAVLAAVLAHCATSLALEDTDMAPAVAEARTGHRAGMIFPLLLAISRRLAALIPTALMSLVAIAAMLVFAKKAFLMSAAALAVALYDSYRSRKKQQKETYHEVFEPMEFTEVHFKPAPPSWTHAHHKSSYGASPYKPSYSYKRPSSYDVPIQPHPGAGAASYYRKPVVGYTKPFDAYNSPSQALDHTGEGGGGGSVSSGGSPGDSYEVVDDYRPLGGGPAFVADGSEQQESFSPFYPNHLQDPQAAGSQQDAGQPAPAASVLSPGGGGGVPQGAPGLNPLNHRPPGLAPQALRQVQPVQPFFQPQQAGYRGPGRQGLGQGRQGRAGKAAAEEAVAS